MLRSKSRPASPSTSPIPAVHGKEAATRTRTDSFVSTSLRAQICHGGVPRTSKQSPGRSTAVRARRSVGRRRQRRSTNSYSPFNNQVLLRSVESGQYLAIRYTERLAEAGVVNSVGSKGDSYDNALAESFNGLYKTELIHRRGPWKNVDHVEWATLTYVDWFNNRRIHNEIGKIPPAEFEENYYRQTATAELVTSQTNESA